MATRKKAVKGQPGLHVRSRSKQGFRRCGFSFTPEGIGIELDSLTKEQVNTLKSEKALFVEVFQVGELKADDSKADDSKADDSKADQG